MKQTQFTYNGSYNKWIIEHIKKICSEKNDKKIKILDVGCWTGTLGVSLYEANINNFEITGIDFILFALEEAKSKGYYEVIEIDLHRDIPQNNIQEKFDIIVFGDVLEHTLNPDRVYETLTSYLKDNGTVLVSLPNIGFLLYRLKLLFGDRTYNPIGVGGIMDTTHYKFFTLKTMKILLNKLPLKIQKIEGYNDVQKKYGFLKLLGKRFPSLFALQICFVVTKK